MLHIVAIGGGELGRDETVPLDEVLARAPGVRRPRALFVPTASFDPPGYAAAFAEVYGRRLGCEVRVLELVARPPGDAELAAEVEAADLVYVGGGNTRAMLARWRARDLDRLLGAAARAGTPVGGLSAGAICWFARAHSHADRYPHPAARGDGCLEGLGLLPGVAAPHFGQQPWRETILRVLLERVGGVGLGLDDHLALEVRGEEYRVLACREGRALHRLRWEGGCCRVERLPPDATWRPLGGLLGTPGPCR